MATTYSYEFTVLRGRQAGREYYVGMCPLNLLPRLVPIDDEEVPPEFRAQRKLNKARVPELASYILDNPTEYVFSALTVSIDARVQFRPFPDCDWGGTLSRGYLIWESALRYQIGSAGVYHPV